MIISCPICLALDRQPTELCVSHRVPTRPNDLYCFISLENISSSLGRNVGTGKIGIVIKNYRFIGYSMKHSKVLLVSGNFFSIIHSILFVFESNILYRSNYPFFFSRLGRSVSNNSCNWVFLHFFTVNETKKLTFIWTIS